MFSKISLNPIKTRVLVTSERFEPKYLSMIQTSKMLVYARHNLENLEESD